MRRALLLSLVLACSGKAETPPSETPCGEGLVREGSGCAPKFDTCPDGALPTFGGGCVPLAPPVLAAPSCADGQLAVPGEAACHPIASCGAAPWGELPDEPNAVWVDGKAADGGDGTRSKPFKSLAEALARARDNALIGIAAGTYTVNVDVSQRVRIHGRCPSMVELAGDPALLTDHVIQATADLELKGVSITSPYIGVGVYDANVTIDSVHFHDTEYSAIEALGYKTPPNLTVRNTVIDRARQLSITLFGANAVVERSNIRNGRSRADGKTGDGIVLRPRKEGSVTHPAKLELRASVIEKTQRSGVTAFGAKLVVEGSIVRGVRTDASGSGGPGVATDPYEGAPADLTIKGALLEDNQLAQLSVNGTAAIERVVARKGVPAKTGLLGGGIVFEEGTKFTLTDTLVEQTTSFGVAVSGAEGTIKNLLVRDVVQDAMGSGGIGLQIGDDETTFAPSTATLSRIRLERCAQLGLLIMGSTVDAEELAIFDIKPSTDQSFGDGMGISAHRIRGRAEPVLASLTLRKSIVERANRAALTLFGADVSIESSRFRCSPIALNAERSYGPPESGDKFERDFLLEDKGNNVCGCGAPAVCKVESAGIVPLR